jgi:drug/metabolite transporter (DMT)-like permease
MFGHVRVSVPLGSIANNLLPALTAAVGCAVGLDHGTFLASFTNIGVILFALLAQLVAVLFSYALRESPVPRAIVFSKIPDLFIPFGIWILTSKFSASDYLFSVATVAACVPVLFEVRDKEKKSNGWLIAVAVGITVQGSLSSALLRTDGFQISEWIAMIGSTVIWRLLFSMILLVWAPERPVEALATLIRTQRWNTLLRSALAVFMQITFILAIAGGHPVIAWPILNATPLFSAVAAAYFLRERPTWPESVACALILVVALARLFIRF